MPIDLDYDDAGSDWLKRSRPERVGGPNPPKEGAAPAPAAQPCLSADDEGVDGDPDPGVVVDADEPREAVRSFRHAGDRDTGEEAAASGLLARRAVGLRELRFPVRNGPAGPRCPFNAA